MINSFAGSQRPKIDLFFYSVQEFHYTSIKLMTEMVNILVIIKSNNNLHENLE